jgi:hypothetical protein
MGHGNWPEFRDWAAFADHKDVLPGLYAVEHRGGVVGKFSKADGTHNGILYRRRCDQPSHAPPQHVFEFLQRHRLRQRLACFLKCLDRLFNEFAKLGEHLLGVVTVGSALHQLRAGADEALVFVRPCDNFQVSVAFRHWCTSSMAFCVFEKSCVPFYSPR